MHPCLSCGACCAHYRVSLHWSEAAVYGTPEELTEPFGPHRLAMRGTWQRQPRCLALHGDIGHDARCGIYPQRPSPCRELQPAWENGDASPQCDKARAAHGLAPLTPADWRWRETAANDGADPDDHGNDPPTPRLPPLAA